MIPGNRSVKQLQFDTAVLMDSYGGPLQMPKHTLYDLISMVDDRVLPVVLNTYRWKNPEWRYGRIKTKEEKLRYLDARHQVASAARIAITRLLTTHEDMTSWAFPNEFGAEIWAMHKIIQVMPPNEIQMALLTAVHKDLIPSHREAVWCEELQEAKEEA